jgi:hypothetical protein
LAREQQARSLFEPAAIAALLALDNGDGVALAGEATPTVWTDNESAWVR